MRRDSIQPSFYCGYFPTLRTLYFEKETCDFPDPHSFTLNSPSAELAKARGKRTLCRFVESSRRCLKDCVPEPDLQWIWLSEALLGISCSGCGTSDSGAYYNLHVNSRAGHPLPV